MTKALEGALAGAGAALDAACESIKRELKDDICRQTVMWLKAAAPAGARIKIDSRTIEQGDVFAAIRGGSVDGLSYAQVAASRHASAMLVEERDDVLGKNAGLPVHVVPGLKDLLGEIASLFYGEPSRHMRGAAVTGTNGKTSVSHWTADALTRLHHPCAVIGTIGTSLAGKALDAPPLTTPDAASLQEILFEAYEKGAQAFAMEASSIGLEQGRMRGTRIETAAFTNLTRDHLDYHATLEAYEKAKSILFDWPELKNAVINIDDEAGVRLARRTLSRGIRTITYSLAGKTMEGAEALNATDIVNADQGIAFAVHWQGKSLLVASHVIGRFNVSNLLAAAGILLTFGIAPEAVFSELENLRAPAGRIEPVTVPGADGQKSPLVIVDYAHTPDALTKVLAALSEVKKARGASRLWVVFGAGGDRDHGKRPLMGAAASAAADEVVITSDNPRSEDPQAIAEAVAAGVKDGTRPRIILDRRSAVLEAVCAARPEDIVLIAGKGHETYQEVRGVRYPMSDVQLAREALIERRTQELRRREQGQAQDAHDPDGAGSNQF